MSTAIAGQVAGPRPGLDFVKFWQGAVDIGLRIVILVSSLFLRRSYSQ